MGLLELKLNNIFLTFYSRAGRSARANSRSRKSGGLERRSFSDARGRSPPKEDPAVTEALRGAVPSPTLAHSKKVRFRIIK